MKIAETGDDLRRHRGWNPERWNLAHVDAPECRSGHSDDGERVPVHQHLPADHIGSASELRLPKIVGNHRHGIRVRLPIVVIREHLPQGRPHSEHWEVVAGDHFCRRGAEIATGREVDNRERAAEYTFEKLPLLIQIAAYGIRHEIQTAEAIGDRIAFPID